jgi:RHS repeat-associated protein
LLTNSSGSLANTYAYDSFGNLTASTGTVSNPFEYTGREFDPETGLYYYRARYYDPSAGRFISEDPIGFKGGANFYRYVRNNTVNATDPGGLYTLKGFPPAQAAQMSIAIGQLAAKLKSRPCCIDPNTANRILNLLQPFNYGSGIAFVYKQTLPSSPGFTTCAEVPSLLGFLTNTVEIS